ncbi:hypothetical protein Tco_1098114 [Tanacetum coccineum]
MASNEMTNIVSKPLVVREIAETNGNTVNIPTRKTHASAHANERDSSIHQQLRNRSYMPHQRQPQRLTFDAPSQPTYYGISTINGNNVAANRDSRHRNYHVTTSQLSAAFHADHPTFLNGGYSFGMGELAWIQLLEVIKLLENNVEVFKIQRRINWSREDPEDKLES